ncbi:MAG: hypothetical protein JW985_03005 [Alphaproteobacteria bacterium]|nr:hypothetical protein [Alphaproteobacteria bacterium]
MSEYEIGYMKPPKNSRFKMGESGNKSGRPRGSKNTYKLLGDLLNQKITMVQDGKPVKIDKKTAILLQAVNSASKGEIKSLQILLPHMLAVDIKNENLENSNEHLSTDDQEILKDFLQRNKDVTKDSENDE